MITNLRSSRLSNKFNPCHNHRTCRGNSVKNIGIGIDVWVYRVCQPKWPIQEVRCP